MEPFELCNMSTRLCEHADMWRRLNCKGNPGPPTWAYVTLFYSFNAANDCVCGGRMRSVVPKLLLPSPPWMIWEH